MTSNPSFSSALKVAVTALCSVGIVTRCVPLCARDIAVPRMARLFDSVAPEVHISRSRAQFSNAATLSLALATNAADLRPAL